MSAPDFAALPTMNDQKKQKFHVIHGAEARPAAQDSAQRFAQSFERGEIAVDSYLNARYDGTNGRPHLSVISDLDSSGNASYYTGFDRALSRTVKEPGKQKQNKTGLKKNKKRDRDSGRCRRLPLDANGRRLMTAGIYGDTGQKKMLNPVIESRRAGMPELSVTKPGMS
ncbi:MAG: hypothetical protein IPL01_00670 [Acidobacteria bacterium]|nr:hypothetical protein [Acidobacteriota bacterium]